MTLSIPRGILVAVAASLFAAAPAACDNPEGAGSVSILQAKEVALQKGIKIGPSGGEAQAKKKKSKVRPTEAPAKGGR